MALLEERWEGGSIVSGGGMQSKQIWMYFTGRKWLSYERAEKK
jgi:hypothetical protein